MAEKPNYLNVLLSIRAKSLVPFFGAGASMGPASSPAPAAGILSSPAYAPSASTLAAKLAQVFGLVEHAAMMILLLALSMISVLKVPALAGPPALCVKAFSSTNGNFLVITEAEFEPASQNMPRRARELTLKIFPNEDLIGKKGKVPAPVMYWVDSVEWSVVLHSRNGYPVLPCPLALVTDDGEFLILIGTDGYDWALQIYRRRDHPGDGAREGADQGTFIRAVSLKELWPRETFSESEHAIRTDESPEWFAQGSFTFSRDSRELIYKTQWGHTVHIDLPSGKVSKE